MQKVDAEDWCEKLMRKVDTESWCGEVNVGHMIDKWHDYDITVFIVNLFLKLFGVMKVFLVN